MNLISITTIICIASAQSIYSATLYTGASLSSITSGSVSDYQGSPVNHVAAKFTLSGATSEVKAVSFYGLYFGGGANSLTVTTDVFDVAFFSDSGNGPGSIIGTAQTSLIAERFATGSVAAGREIYQYELDLSSSISLTASNYWIAISRNNPSPPSGTGGNWIWAGDHSSVLALQSQGSNQFTMSGTDNANPAFTLENTTFAVPEPQVFGLALVTLASCLAKRRRI